MEGEWQNWRWIFPQMSLGGMSFKTNTFFTWSAIIIIAILKKTVGLDRKSSLYYNSSAKISSAKIAATFEVSMLSAEDDPKQWKQLLYLK